MEINFEKELNHQQYLASTSKSQYLRIIAGAGTGKTRTLTYRLAYVILNNSRPANSIVAITFTNKAANEMKQRTLDLLSQYGFDLTKTPIISTFHSFCIRFLRRELARHYVDFKDSFTIINEEDSNSIYREIAEKMGCKIKDDRFKQALSYIHSWKTKGFKVEDVVIDENDIELYPKKEALDVYRKYQERVIKSGQLDFDDVLIYTKEIMSKDEEVKRIYSSYYSYFLVDEFQDTNDLQYEIVKLFMNEDTGLCVVGDPDQTIYTWRGANNSLIKSRLSKDFPNLETITLDLNYRSSNQILDVANKVIDYNIDRTKKELHSFNNRNGKPVSIITGYNEQDEANQISNTIFKLHNSQDVEYSKIAIIYRSNYLSRAIEKSLKFKKIPYKIYGGLSFYQREEVASGLAYLKLLINQDDDISLKRVFKFPKRGIGEKTYENMVNQANSLNISLLELIIDNFDTLKVSENIKTNLSSFVSGYKNITKTILENPNNGQIIVKAVAKYFNEVGLFSYYDKVDQDTIDKNGSSDNSRVDNLKELINDIKSYFEESIKNPSEDTPPDLAGFLINVSLFSDQDELDEEQHVSLMTGHVSKGLEYPIVFVTGLVQGVFPSNHSLNDKNPTKALQEERRLCYVMFTRAKNELYLSTFGGRNFQDDPNLPSTFLKEAGFKVSVKSGFTSSISSNNSLYRSIDKLYSSLSDDDTYPSYVRPTQKQEKPTNSSVVKSVTASFLSSNKEDYKVGDKIAHVSYGTGVVVEEDKNYIRVDFGPDYGIKKLAKGFKAFKKVS